MIVLHLKSASPAWQHKILWLGRWVKLVEDAYFGSLALCLNVFAVILSEINHTDHKSIKATLFPDELPKVLVKLFINGVAEAKFT